MILPAMGMVSDIISTFSRKPLFGYKPMVLAIAGIAGLGFIVWGHHMFQSGMDPRLGTGFMLATIMIALPSAVKVFNWLGTIWGGNIQYTTAMLNALAFVAMFVIGGLSGIFMAATPVDMYIHDTYFIVAHLHYVLFMSSVFGIFGAIYYWFPKMFGRLMNEKWGKVHFALTFLFSNCVFFPMHIIGIAGHPRRYYDSTLYRFLDNVQPLNQFMTICALLLGLSQLIFLVNFFVSLFRGAEGGREPVALATRWNGRRRRRRRTATSRRCRSFAAGLMNTASRTSRRIICRRRRRNRAAFRRRRIDTLRSQPRLAAARRAARL